MTYRDEIVELCKKAGMDERRVQEIADGCNTARAYRIIIGQQQPFQPGTLTLSDWDAALDAELIALDCLIERTTLDRPVQ